jgi:hypothetical protein
LLHYSVRLRGQTVFIYWDCDPSANKVIPIFNCEVTWLNPRDDIPLEDLKNQKVIWTPDNLVCEIN